LASVSAEAGRSREFGLPARLPGFDLSEGLHRLQGNRALYRRLLLDFADQHRREAETLRRLLDDGDFDRARHRVHAIKGVAGNLAAKSLQAAAGALEMLVQNAGLARASDAVALKAAFSGFQTALEAAVAAAASLKPTGSAGKGCSAGGKAPALVPGIAADVTAGLRAAAELGDASEVTALARCISARCGERSATGARILRMAEDFDFDGILRLVDELEALR
jgi:HPt (histidine-containing phosphotransfer) domain-containing protein